MTRDSLRVSLFARSVTATHALPLSLSPHATGLWGVPKSFGKIKCFDKFDDEFFNMDQKTASYTDPQDRVLLEATYEAILDAGELTLISALSTLHRSPFRYRFPFVSRSRTPFALRCNSITYALCN